MIRNYTLLLLTLLLSSLQAMAQRERNYIYLLDCSQSMTDYRVGNRTLWESTLEYLQRDIARQTPSSQINIIPFQGQLYDVTSCQQRDFDWTKFHAQVKDYPKTLTGTNICAAWDKALSLQDPRKDNYLFLLTDGEDNKQGVDALCRRIREWCERVRNTYGYYVMLTSDAMNPKIVDEVNRCQHLFLVDAQEGLRPFGSIERESFVYNTLEPSEIVVPFSAAGTFRAHIVNHDPNFDIELVGNTLSNGRGTLRITPRGDLTQLDKVLLLEPELQGDDVNILNPRLSITVNNQPERLLSLPTEEVDLGEASWYDAFLWCDAKQPDTLTIDLGPAFNEAARAEGSSLVLGIASLDAEGNIRTLEPEVKVYHQGQACCDGTLQLQPGQSGVLSVVFSPNASQGKHYLVLSTQPGSVRNLERVNDGVPTDYMLTLRAAYDVTMNPLKVLLIWLGILLLAALLLWFVVLRPLLYPTIRLKNLQIESEPIYKNPVIKGCRKVVFTARRQDQGIVNRIFTGEVKYVRDDMFDTDWQLTPGTRRDAVRIGNTGGYLLNPPGSSLKRHETVTMKSNATGRIIRITPK